MNVIHVPFIQGKIIEGILHQCSLKHAQSIRPSGDSMATPSFRLYNISLNNSCTLKVHLNIRSLK